MNNVYAQYMIRKREHHILANLPTIFMRAPEKSLSFLEQREKWSP